MAEQSTFGASGVVVGGCKIWFTPPIHPAATISVIKLADGYHVTVASPPEIASDASATDDLVDRLENKTRLVVGVDDIWEEDDELAQEAAAEIKRLRAALLRCESCRMQP
jgi:hypothetical protein